MSATIPVSERVNGVTGCYNPGVCEFDYDVSVETLKSINVLMTILAFLGFMWNFFWLFFLKRTASRHDDGRRVRIQPVWTQLDIIFFGQAIWDALYLTMSFIFNMSMLLTTPYGNIGRWALIAGNICDYCGVGTSMVNLFYLAISRLYAVKKGKQMSLKVYFALLAIGILSLLAMAIGGEIIGENKLQRSMVYAAMDWHSKDPRASAIGASASVIVVGAFGGIVASYYLTFRHLAQNSYGSKADEVNRRIALAGVVLTATYAICNWGLLYLMWMGIILQEAAPYWIDLYAILGLHVNAEVNGFCMIYFNGRYKRNFLSLFDWCTCITTCLTKKDEAASRQSLTYSQAPSTPKTPKVKSPSKTSEKSSPAKDGSKKEVKQDDVKLEL